MRANKKGSDGEWDKGKQVKELCLLPHLPLPPCTLTIDTEDSGRWVGEQGQGTSGASRGPARVARPQNTAARHPTRAFDLFGEEAMETGGSGRERVKEGVLNLGAVSVSSLSLPITSSRTPPPVTSVTVALYPLTDKVSITSTRRVNKLSASSAVQHPVIVGVQIKLDSFQRSVISTQYNLK